jgi:hypothetical protein
VSCHIEKSTFVGSSSYSVEDSPRRSSFVFWTSRHMHHELEVTFTCGNKKSQLVNNNSDRFQMHKQECYRRSKRREEKRRIGTPREEQSLFSQMHIHSFNLRKFDEIDVAMIIDQSLNSLVKKTIQVFVAFAPCTCRIRVIST